MSRKKNKPIELSTEDWMTFEENGGGPRLSLSGELGFFEVPALEQALWKFRVSRKNTSLDVDLSEVSAIVDSRIINVFIQANRRSQRRKIQLRLLGANRVIRHAFESVKASGMLFTE
jgi:anti-anti-sigma regulatory factor